MKRPIAFVLCLAASVSISNNVRAGSLGVAGNYNEFIFTTSTRSNVDSQGQVAVGGTATFNNFTVGSNINSGNIYGTDSLIVGGRLTGSQTVVQGYGNALYGSKDSNTHLYFNGGGSGSVGTISGFFSNAETYLTSLATTLKNEVANGTTYRNPYGQMTLTTNGSSQLQVFNVNGSDLSSINNLSIHSSSTNDTIVINVSGTNDSMQNFGINLHGIDETHILFNFYDATSLNLSGINVTGSILATKALLTGNNGQINGNVIANAMTGNIETHLHLFDGTLPTPGAVPEPSSLGLMAAAGLIPVISMIRRIRGKKA